MSSSSIPDGLVISLGLFGASSYWFLRNVVRKQQSLLTPFHKRRQKSLSDLRKQNSELRRVVAASSDNTDADLMIDNLSERGQGALIPPIPYLQQLLTCLQDPCDVIQNPTGYIALCMAENKLVTRLFAERCQEATSAAFQHDAVYCYNSFLGMQLAREAAAYFLARRFLFADEFNNNNTAAAAAAGDDDDYNEIPPQVALQHIQPQHVALSAGAAAILHNLFFLLGSAGDACLIPAPYYAAFENDMNVVAGVVPFAVHQANPIQGPTVAELDLAYMQAKSAGLKPRFLLLTNPNNPLAVIYRPDVMRNAVTWARKRRLETIVDELYALSTHQKQRHAFQSIIRILDNKLGPDVHMLWAASKDFGASGLRYGVLYSQNEWLMNALSSLSTFTCVSGPIQHLMSEVLTDDTFVDEFLEESRERLLHSYNICISKLEEMVLPFVPAEAAMFVYVDFSSLLPEKTFAWEEKLSDLMFRQVHVVLTPGSSQHDTTPGMFRICYAWVPPDVLEIAMERLSRLVAKLRRMDWDDLSGRALESVLYGL